MTKVRTQKPLVIFVVRKDMLLMCVEARMRIGMTNLKIWVIVISTINKVIRHMNARQEPCMHQDLKVTATTIKSMDIEPTSVDLSPCGHQKNKQRQEVMDTSIIGTTIVGKAITIVKSMDTSLKTA